VTDTFSISDLAAEFAVTTRTIRFYEGEGMISPERRGTTRVYHLRDRIRLKLILRGKRLGLSLSDIREIIDMYDQTSGEVGQLKHLMIKIDERRLAFEEQKRDLDLLLTELDDVREKCENRLTEIVE
jgi:DNA-binding transcriptional MerR regulator